MSLRHVLLLGLCLLLAQGCVNRIELDETNPASADVGGRWILDVGASDPTPDFRRNRVGQVNARTSAGAQRQALRIALGSGLAFIVQDFQILSANELNIELNADSMGVQHLPGVYRDVSWGEKQRGLWLVYAGWEGNDLVIFSDAEDLKVVERMQRIGNRLRVEVQLEADGREETLVRVFRRPT